MRKKLTIALDKLVCEGLHSAIGRGLNSAPIESLVRPHEVGKDLEAGYRELARASETMGSAESFVGDVVDEVR
jgi:hypothetical protein